MILAKTVKGYGMGTVGEGKNIAHQQKKMPIEALRQFRDRFQIPIADDKLEELPYYRPTPTRPRGSTSARCARSWAGRCRSAGARAPASSRPSWTPFKPLLEATGEGREISTTMAFVRMLTGLVKDQVIGKHVVPIVPDESRTFGMEGLFRQIGIYSQAGQLYEPEDSDQLMFYKEDKNGQILQEGINEAGATARSSPRGRRTPTDDVRDDPVLHLLLHVRHAAGRGPHLGGRRSAHARLPARGTSGRTTLNGEGLQHEDGHSHVMAGTVPNCVSYDPTFAYEVAVIMQDGLRRMVEEPGGCLLLHHPDERELPAPGPARGTARARGSSRGCTSSPTAARPIRKPGRASSCWAAASSCAR